MNFKIIKKIIDDWDPIDLWRSHCPADEYDDETREIAALIKNVKDENIIAEIIYKVFIVAFNEELFHYKLDDCKEIAKLIISHIKS